MKYIRFLRVFIIAAFCCSILLPLLFTDFNGGRISIDENRYLASRPSFDSTFSTKEFDSWINDNIGGRSLALLTAERFNYAIAGEHSGDIVEGKDKWLYLLPDYNIPDYSNVYVPDKHYFEQYVARFEEIERILDQQGIKIIFGMFPRKFNVYPEYMPNTIIRREPTSYDEFSSIMKANKNIIFFDPMPELCEAKQHHLTYSKAKDASHWNNYGAYIAYQSMMNAAKIVLPEIQILSENDFIIEEKQYVTKKNNGFITDEKDFEYVLKQDSTINDKEYLTQIGFNGTDQWRSYNYFRNKDSSLPKAIIVGDSFTWMFMLEKVAQSFSELAFIHDNDLSQLNLLIDKIEPDIIFAQYVGTTLTQFSEFEPTLTVRQIIEKIDTMPIKDDAEWFCQYLDICGDNMVESNILQVNPDSEKCYLEGWAIDPSMGETAGMVLIQMDDKYYRADYGKERQSVVDAFGNDAYLNSGYTILLDTAEILAAGEIAIHVISADGTYRYPPAIYHVDGATTEDKSSPKDLPVLDYTADMGYQFLDLCGEQAVTADTISVDTENTECYIEGWAVDPIHGGTAGNVVIRVGEHDYTATYGKPRQSVAEIYGSDDYLNCGYSAVLNTQEVLEAGEITVHVIASDGAGQYPPVTYRAEPMQK